MLDGSKREFCNNNQGGHEHYVGKPCAIQSKHDFANILNSNTEISKASIGIMHV